MTTAVCFKCGAIKFGAFVPCPECGGFPRNEDELALSLAMTDHYFDMPTLDQMGATIRDGTRRAASGSPLRAAMGKRARCIISRPIFPIPAHAPQAS